MCGVAAQRSRRTFVTVFFVVFVTVVLVVISSEERMQVHAGLEPFRALEKIPKSSQPVKPFNASLECAS